MVKLQLADTRKEKREKQNKEPTLTQLKKVPMTASGD